VDSVSGAGASEGDYAMSAAITMSGTAWEALSIARTRPTPYVLSQGYSASTSPSLSDLILKIDIDGDPAFNTGSGDGTNLFVILNESDGDQFRFINFTEPALGTDGYSDLRVGFFDVQGTGDGVLNSVSSYTILIENPFAVAKSGTLVFDNLRLEEPTSEPEELVYTIPLIAQEDAPNVTDTTFDAIYDNGGTHPVIGGDDWKDYAQRSTDPYAAIGDPYASVSKAYLVSDGVRLYFGMLVYDPDTSLMTADTGNDTGTKWGVESIEVALSREAGASGAADAAKFSVDAFGHIDDMLPDGTTASNTSALTQHNSYIVDSNTWALEFSVAISELTGSTALSAPPQTPPHDWYGHIGYQSPTPGGSARVPFYAAARGDGFTNSGFASTRAIWRRMPRNAGVCSNNPSRCEPCYEQGVRLKPHPFFALEGTLAERPRITLPIATQTANSAFTALEAACKITESADARNHAPCCPPHRCRHHGRRPRQSPPATDSRSPQMPARSRRRVDSGASTAHLRGLRRAAHPDRHRSRPALVEQACQGVFEGELSFSHNAEFDRTNSLYSLGCTTLEAGKGGLLILNSDVLFHPGQLAALIADPRENVLLAAFGGSLGEEEMKIRTDAAERIEAISKQMAPETGQAENLGVLKVAATTARRMFELARTPGGVEGLCWVPDAVQYLCKAIDFYALAAEGWPWIEIDYPHDLERAREVVWPRIAPALATS
jgi:choline kinase